MSDLKGKVAVVTGASKGIGAGVARAFGAVGAAVVVNYASDRAGADKVVADIKAKGGKAIAVQGDVAKAADVQKLFATAKETFGGVHVLVNNAGVYKFDAIENVTEDEFHRQFNINVLGTVLATREAVKYFGPNGGSVINVGSNASAEATVPTASVYSATKGAVDTLTRVLAAELGPRKIRVNIIAPGGTETEGLVTAGVKGSEFEKALVDRTALGRLGQPDDIARVAVFLASDDSAWMTGERLAATGGYR
ncbi:oxidoreductase [Pseudolabrys sp. Root1462]|uniref:SDR family NAD(P)-dependent oxidoreductase n=1 Tax=Pseudolabrys sp. Root1462 TaxID=1736466 RepID=UPI0007032302|nr:glucose 1-dehydrogenase [Pseudolabrys sp. Root1462]KQY97337.1 oxidoreductase [Pseudolabrys sp. Root1462]